MNSFKEVVSHKEFDNSEKKYETDYPKVGEIYNRHLLPNEKNDYRSLSELSENFSAVFKKYGSIEDTSKNKGFESKESKNEQDYSRYLEKDKDGIYYDRETGKAYISVEIWKKKQEILAKQCEGMAKFYEKKADKEYACFVNPRENGVPNAEKWDHYRQSQEYYTKAQECKENASQIREKLEIDSGFGDDGKNEQNIQYKLRGAHYTADALGRVILCEDTPKRTPENTRDISAQLQAGGEDRRPQDQGGHIVSRDLNGDSGAGNLVSMDYRINQSDYRRMENDIKGMLDEGKEVARKTELTYSGESKRPDIITTTVKTDENLFIYKFDNNMDGSLLKDISEKERAAVDAELKDTDGKISSIRREYDKDGNLIETTVNIIYTDENGINHRTKVSISE